MAIEVLTPPARTRLVTLDTVARALELADDGEDLALAADFIDQASDAISRICRRSFARADYRETVAGYGTTALVLTHTPVVSVALVTHNSEPITDYEIGDPEAGTLFRARGWVHTAGVGWGITSYVIPSSEAPRFTVEYTAGWVLPYPEDEPAPGDPAADLPAAIQRAALLAVQDYWQRRDGSARVTTKRVGQLSVTHQQPGAAGNPSAWRAGAFELPAEALALIQPFVRVEL